MTEPPTGLLVAEALQRAARVAGVNLLGVDVEQLARDLAAAGLLLTPEREAELRAEARADALAEFHCTECGGHPAPGVEPHHYLSTACLHGEHTYCQNRTGRHGEKLPARCKFCPASCVCFCHQPTTSEETPTHD